MARSLQVEGQPQHRGSRPGLGGHRRQGLLIRSAEPALPAPARRDRERTDPYRIHHDGRTRSSRHVLVTGHPFRAAHPPVHREGRRTGASRNRRSSPCRRRSAIGRISEASGQRLGRPSAPPVRRRAAGPRAPGVCGAAAAGPPKRDGHPRRRPRCTIGRGRSRLPRGRRNREMARVRPPYTTMRLTMTSTSHSRCRTTAAATARSRDRSRDGQPNAGGLSRGSASAPRRTDARGNEDGTTPPSAMPPSGPHPGVWVSPDL